MSLNAALEIVITLAAVFWLLALVASFFMEALNSFGNARAKALERFIADMVIGERSHGLRFNGPSSDQRLKSSKDQTHPKWVGDGLGVLSHALVKSLRKPTWLRNKENTAPSYIPASVFAQALLDRVSSLAAAAAFDPADVDSVWQRLVWLSPPPNSPLKLRGPPSLSPPGDGAAGLQFCSDLFHALGELTLAEATRSLEELGIELSQGRISPESSPFEGFLAALLGEVLECFKRVDAPQITNDSAVEPVSPPQASLLKDILEPGVLWVVAMQRLDCRRPADLDMLDAVRMVVAHGPLPRALREALVPIIEGSNYSPEAMRAGVEAWFNAVMDRASGWFKRYTTVQLGAAGLFLAVVLNINPFGIAQDLASEPESRRVLVDLVDKATKEPMQAVQAESAPQARFMQAAKGSRWDMELEQAVSSLRGGEKDLQRSLGHVHALAFELQPLLLRHPELKTGLMPLIARPSLGGREKLGRAELAAGFCQALRQIKGPEVSYPDCDKAFQGFLSFLAWPELPNNASFTQEELVRAWCQALSHAHGRALSRDDCIKPFSSSLTEFAKVGPLAPKRHDRASVQKELCQASKPSQSKESLETCSEGVAGLMSFLTRPEPPRDVKSAPIKILRREFENSFCQAASQVRGQVVSPQECAIAVEGLWSRWAPAHLASEEKDRFKELAQACLAPAHSDSKTLIVPACKEALSEANPDRDAVVRTIWQNPAWVWNPALATALWDALQALQSAVLRYPSYAQQASSAAGRPSSPAPAASNTQCASLAKESNTDYPEVNVECLRRAYSKALDEANQSPELAAELLKRLPSVGWSRWSWPTWQPHLTCIENLFAVLCWAVVSLSGWLLTALMVSFGAPFWFDLLSKLIQRRATGPRPATDTE